MIRYLVNTRLHAIRIHHQNHAHYIEYFHGKCQTECKQECVYQAMTKWLIKFFV